MGTKYATKKKKKNRSMRKSENTSRQMKMETQLTKIYGMQQKEKEVYSDTGLPQ